MDDILSRIAWMAWTWQTLVFFGTILGLLVLMTVLAAFRPEMPHVGLLRFATTRSDRLFVSLLGTAFVFLVFVRFGGQDFLYPSLASLALAAILFRFA